MVPTILVVEDDPMTAKILRLLLKREGYAVTVVQNASAALSVVGQLNPNLIILDVMLPGMDGYEACQLLRREPATANLPILMFTALARPSDQRRGFVAGADDYLIKPISSHDLLSRVRALLYFAPELYKEE